MNWILDLDLKGFFDNIDPELLMEMIERRIADPRILRLIRKWLKAGVIEDGEWSETEKGTPLTRGKDDWRPCPGIRSAVRLRFEAGAVISPLLANIGEYLSALRTRPVDRPMEAAGARRRHHRSLRR